ncbi:MAG: hypothetical protein JOZ58_24505 [Acetobacteraceae bacterium]|nr:hypothetical protein [Alphaproteobacteria bacterium]MBV8578179.1 hypothetical protein [Acetobacteraceae bacterium]
MTRHPWPVVPNLARDMQFGALDRLWVADITGRLRWNAERQAMEIGVEIGEYRGVVRVPRRSLSVPAPGAVRRSLPPPANPIREQRRAEAPPAINGGREVAGFIEGPWLRVPYSPSP